ncbi:hypothetical protein [Paenibacillus humicola]|uniref:hypothetical protein n=1 Tax=Paenibacillus humicola TaxID=3110540 RepID=UPI00237A393E|nr:hypothetical protein [Paenibacillus humicola]
MSRMEKFGSRRSTGTPTGRGPAAVRVAAGPDRPLPSRRLKHPSNKETMTKWFYRILIGMFLLLLVSLFLWGRRYTAL